MYCIQGSNRPRFIPPFRPRCHRVKFKTWQIHMSQTIFLYLPFRRSEFKTGRKCLQVKKGGNNTYTIHVYKTCFKVTVYTRPFINYECFTVLV